MFSAACLEESRPGCHEAKEFGSDRERHPHGLFLQASFGTFTFVWKSGRMDVQDANFLHKQVVCPQISNGSGRLRLFLAL